LFEQETSLTRITQVQLENAHLCVKFFDDFIT
jgi:hypothetical protein